MYSWIDSLNVFKYIFLNIDVYMTVICDSYLMCKEWNKPLHLCSLDWGTRILHGGKFKYILSSNDYDIMKICAVREISYLKAMQSNLNIWVTFI